MADKHLKKKDSPRTLLNGKEYCVGLTDEAQEEFGGITFANLPKVGQSLKEDKPLTGVEAEKAVSEFANPSADTVSSVNDKIGEDINILDGSDEMNAWILGFKDADPKEFDEL